MMGQDREAGGLGGRKVMQRELMGEEFQGGRDELSQNCQEDIKWVMRDVAWIWQSWWEWFLGGGGGGG